MTLRSQLSNIEFTRRSATEVNANWKLNLVDCKRDIPNYRDIRMTLSSSLRKANRKSSQLDSITRTSLSSNNTCWDIKDKELPKVINI